MIGWPFSFSPECRTLVWRKKLLAIHHSGEDSNLTNSGFVTARRLLGGFWYRNSQGYAAANIAQAA